MNTQIYEEASEWFVSHRAGDTDADARRKFDAWLRVSPQHVAAYLEIAAIWNEGPALDPQKAIDIDVLIERARMEPDNVVPLPVVASALASSSSLECGGGARIYTRRLAVAASLFIVASAGVFGWMYTQRGVYVTEIGEQRSVQLADGSTVELNTRSRIRVRYTEDQRSVELLEGQALFQVAKDSARVFIVTSDTTRVRAVGTQFDVYRRESGTTVTVLEGQVAVLSSGATEVAIAGTNQPSLSGVTVAYLGAGEQVNIKRGMASQPKPANLEVATAWTKRQLIFESATIEEVAEEFNRYNQRQLIVQTADTRDFHISGVFSSTDPASLIRFLRERPGIEVQETDREIYITRE
jgi:transmembrane sensor